jgi:predicted PurR-regulated permease PerM
VLKLHALVPTGGAVINVLIVVVIVFVFVVIIVIVVAVDQLRRCPRWIALRSIGGTRLGQSFRDGFLHAT